METGSLQGGADAWAHGLGNSSVSGAAGATAVLAVGAEAAHEAGLGLVEGWGRNGHRRVRVFDEEWLVQAAVEVDAGKAPEFCS